MFRIVLTSIVTCVHLYVFWRAASVPLIRRHIGRKYVIAAGMLLWALFIAARLFARDATGPAGGMLEFLGMTWMGVLFLLFVSLLAVDIMTVFGFVLPRKSPSLRGVALAVGGVLSVVALVQGLRPPVVQDYEVRLHGLPSTMDGAVVVALSDLHLGSLIGEKWLAARVAQVMDLKPDLVVLLGDTFEGHGEPGGTLVPALRRLSAPLGVWAVPGNHEFYGGIDGNMAAFDEAGIGVLRNRWVEIRPGFILAGIDDITSAYRAGGEADFIASALASLPPGVVVFLSHSPLQTERAAAAGVNLMLSGHTHGGQIWPFGYLVRRSYPFLEGRYEVDGMTLLVSRGAGTWGPRMRLWHPGEILRVTLRSE